MKAPRYVALIPAGPQGGAASDLAFATGFARRVRDIPEMQMVHASELLQLASNQVLPVGLQAESLVLGSLFPRGSGDPVARFDGRTADRIASSRGAELVEGFWGSYVAFLTDPDRKGIDIVRAPFGRLPCYMASGAHGLALASDIGLLVDCGFYQPAVAWDEVIHHLLVRDMVRPQTCLAGVQELQGGQRLTVAGGQTGVEQLWSPWTFAGADRQVEDPEPAASAVRDAARISLAAATSGHSGVLLMLSGGLDSSLVAACLARTGMRVHCLTFVTEDATGDERRYARRVCEALGLPLGVGWRDLARIDVMRSDACRLPRPSVRMFFQESRRLALAAAREAGATAILNGGGGDHVFCSLQSGGPAADRLLTSGPGSAFWQTCQDISRLAPASLWSVVADAVARAWLGKPAFRSFRDIALLSGEAVAAAAPPTADPWLRLPSGALAGKAQHVRLVALARGIAEGGDVQEDVPMLSPLLAQPLVEACLAVPSWLWFGGGHNRVVARRAFATELPPDILWRRSKGTPDAFTARIFDRNRSKLRDMLAGGQLVARGIVDPDRLLCVLDDPRPVQGDAFRRVLQLADVEAWANGWTASCARDR